MVKEVYPVPPAPQQPNSHGLGLGLSQLSNRSGLVLPESRGLWFNNQEIYLDGWKFISCRFDNCKIHVSTGNFVIERCFIDNTNIIYYMGTSVNIIQLYNRGSEWARTATPGFAAAKNEDGTLTIGA
ncbi:hypothetical protein KTJ90_08205 [Pantoea jilinensis]|nr:hypothetical protein KTJ90_08205 [Pantoea jilinensis]